MCPAKKSGIDLETLIGISKVKCKRLSAQMGNRKGTEEQIPILVVEVMEGEHSGVQAKYGLVTPEVVETVLGEAEEENGDITILLPTPTELELTKINWVNVI